MSQLSAQSIRRLCETDTPMIDPFVGEKQIVNGKSYGLSAASYDVRIAHDLTLGPNPSYLLAEMAQQWPNHPRLLTEWGEKMRDYPCARALAHTEENFAIPNNVAGYVVDKSSYARVFVSAFNTFLDPGWSGNLTLELVNLGTEIVEIKAQDPICQIVFHWLDEPTERPYLGKYLNQTKAPHPARYEMPDGGWK